MLKRDHNASLIHTALYNVTRHTHSLHLLLLYVTSHKYILPYNTSYTHTGLYFCCQSYRCCLVLLSRARSMHCAVLLPPVTQIHFPDVSHTVVLHHVHSTLEHVTCRLQSLYDSSTLMRSIHCKHWLATTAWPHTILQIQREKLHFSAFRA